MASVLNPAWDINSMMMFGLLIGRIVWLVLDIIIFAINAVRLRNKKKASIYILAELLIIIILRWIFMVNTEGMIWSVFSIDLIMAVDYIAEQKRISIHGQIPIASTKLMADLCAWIAYIGRSRFAAVVGCMVFFVNLFYLAICMEISSRQKKQKPRGGR